MPVLWIAFSILTLLALLIVAVPVLTHMRKNNQSGVSEQTAGSKQANIMLFRDRVAELESDLRDGRLNKDEFDKLRRELDKSLLNDIGEDDDSALSVASNKVRTGALIVLTIVGIPLLSVFMYSEIGSYQRLKQAQWMDETREELAAVGNDMDGMLQKLEQRLASNPGNIEGWVLLGRSYLSLQRYPEASKAFTQLVTQLEQQGENPAPAYGLLAQSIYFASETMTPGVQSAIKKALAADPNEGNALSLLGIAAFQQQRYEDAIRYWQKILDNSPEDPNVEALRGGIARAKQIIASRSGSPLIAGTGSESSTRKNEPSAEANNSSAGGEKSSEEAATGAELQVRVSLPETMLASVSPGDTLFVLARPVGGRMPLAVTRRSAGELPLIVTLNDSMAMGPMAKLSTVEEVEVVARISKSGTPQPQAGDIEGIAGPITVKQQQDIVQLVLDKTLP